MAFEPKFFRCAHCGQVISMHKDAGVPIVCCGQRMDRLTPNTMDAAQEKHMPLAVRDESCTLTVKVGSAAHPMLEAHFVEWIYLQTANGGRWRILAPGEAPEAVFCVCQEEVLAVYAYCNLHGLWVAAVA